MQEKKEKKFCPNCKRRGFDIELILIPPRDGRLEQLFCYQCEKDYPCGSNEEKIKPARIICY